VVFSFTPWLVYPQGKSPWHPVDRRLGRSKSRSGCSGEEKNFQPALGIEPQNPMPTQNSADTTNQTLYYNFMF
jgi:hypothetical protein